MKSTMDGEWLCFEVKRNVQEHLSWKVVRVPIQRVKPPKTGLKEENFPISREMIEKMEDEMVVEVFDVAMFVLECTRQKGEKVQRRGLEIISEKAEVATRARIGIWLRTLRTGSCLMCVDASVWSTG